MRKILVALLTILFSMTIMFIVIQSMPGNPVETLAHEMSRNENLSFEIAYERAKATLNYDPDIPVLRRYLEFIMNLSRGSLGSSLVYRQQVSQVVLGALPWTLLVLILAITLSFTIGILLGIYIAWRQKKWMNTTLTAYQSLFGSIPDYIVAYLLVLIFAINLGWLPSRGPYSASIMPGFTLAFIRDVIRHALLPVLSFFITTVASWTIAMKTNSLGVLGEDYVTYATARGLSKGRILTSYLARNAMLPLVTAVGITFSFMFGGSPLIENLFVYPGVGYYLNIGIARRDFPLMQGMYLIMIVMVVAMSLLTEFIYRILNPRLRGN
ncbi:MAG: ABC transporter permease [Treponema sp.]|nr:ABC transporter permease [Treponema sp.]